MSELDIPRVENGRLDVRETPCKIKHGLIMEAWRTLEPGTCFVLVNGHDPLPLYYQISTSYPGELDWQYEERGPAVYAIRITKLMPGAEAAPVLEPMEARQRCVADPDAVTTSPGVDVDARGLQPPDPMLRILEACALLDSRMEIRALTDRRPVPLEAMLVERGLRICSEERPDGSWLNVIRKA